MSNQADIYLTKFSTLDLDGTVESETYGLRIADDEASTYSNFFVKEDIVGKTPADILRLAEQVDETAADIISFARENHDGINIADHFYTWDELNGNPKP